MPNTDKYWAYIRLLKF